MVGSIFWKEEAVSAVKKRPEQQNTNLSKIYIACSYVCPSHLKVETIGDAYMVAGDIPVPVPTHAE